jgi:hypothetical protein
MHHKGFKCSRRAFHNHLIALHQADYIHSSVGMMRYFFSKPMPSGFNEFTFMQSGSLFHPPIAFGNFFDAIYQVFRVSILWYDPIESPFCHVQC